MKRAHGVYTTEFQSSLTVFEARRVGSNRFCRSPMVVRTHFTGTRPGGLIFSVLLLLLRPTAETKTEGVCAFD